MRIPASRSSSKTWFYLLRVLLLSGYVHKAFSVPHHLSARQDSLAALQLPTCALTCFLNGILSDGCANEADFACHCTSGNIISEAKACIEQGCDKADEKDAFSKVQAGCRALGGSAGSGQDGGSSSGESSTSATSSTKSNEPNSSTTNSTPTTQLAPSTTDAMITPVPSTTSDTPPSSATPSRASGSPTSSSPLPTDMPLALLPTSDQLSAGAKAGISVTVSIFAISVFCALGWYIRRLKRELKAAQRAAAGIPDDVWRSSIATAAAPAGIDRRSSFGRGRRTSRYGRESPVSPLSPRDMAEIMTVTDNGYGVLKKKRGHVLSIVVEREEEDGSSILDRIAIREPVPGQREGLSGPLELDGEYTGIVELPIAITPRERSMER